ncbi:MAG: hypothetical protein IJN80_00035 [Clostridia bacterium]|nr:hypothetical protein [Clostridia bacterium]
MKRLLALLLIAMMILSGCKAASDEEEAAADQWVEKEENGDQSEKMEFHEIKEEEPSEDPQEQEEKPQAEQSQEENPPKEEEQDEEEQKEPSDSIVMKVEYNDSTELERLTKGDLGKHFDYEIYYYGIKNFYIHVEGKTVELREALAKDPKILDELYAEWDRGVKHTYYDGGSVEYPYETYKAARIYTLGVQPDRNSPKDLIICKSEKIDKLKDRIEDDKGGINCRYIFKAVGTTLDIPPAFGLEENGWFLFRLGSAGGTIAIGTYAEEGGKLIFQDKQYEDPKKNVNKYVFEKVEGGYRFLAKESSEIPSYQYGENTEALCPLPDGTVFEAYNN